ncbi:hypothetical protein BDZ89DRAFT_1067786 [Hymenopellis radicata]|nr:hypothetical protein BDZ89DRAFT_1067786 [Hymenopellis radicata]
MQPVASTSSLLPPKQSLIPQKRSLDTATDDGIRCKCGYKHDDGFSIGCDKCERWCHGACFGIFANINEPKDWLCWECDPKQKGKHKRRKESPVIVVDDQEEEKTYVPITEDIVPQPETRKRLREHASSWRGVSALSPSPSHLRSTPDSSSSILPPSYTLHTSNPVPPETYLSPFVSSITPSAAYLADPLNAYAHLGMPKPFVHLFGPPLDLALDTRLVGNKSRWVRSGCRPNAVLRPMLCSSSSEELGFGLFATRSLEKDEEIVLGWEWDDGNVVHHLPTLLNCPDMFKPTEKDHIKKQMSSVLHALESTFAKCACGKDTKGECALERMKKFVDGQEDKGNGDLGPLVGAERGFRTQEKVPWSGGIGGPIPPEIMPPKMRKASLRMKCPAPPSPNPATSPTSAFANLSLASPFTPLPTAPREQPMEIDTDVPSTPSLIFTSTTTTASPSSINSPPPPQSPLLNESTLPPMMAHKSRSPSSIPAALSRRRNSRSSGVHWQDVDMLDADNISPRTVPLSLSPSSPPPDIRTPRSVSAPRSVQIDCSPTQSPSSIKVELSDESAVPPEDTVPTVPRTPSPLPVPTTTPSTQPSLISTTAPTSERPAPDSPAASVKSPIKAPSPPPNRPNENSPPSGVPPLKKISLKDFAARRKKEQREREERERELKEKLLSPAFGFHTPAVAVVPESEVPIITTLRSLDSLEGSGEGVIPQTVVGRALQATQQAVLPEVPVRAASPEVHSSSRTEPSPAVRLHSPEPVAQPPLSARLGSHPPDSVPRKHWDERKASLPPPPVSFAPKVEDRSPYPRELAAALNSVPAPSPHHLPPKPLVPSSSGHTRQRSNSPLSPMGEYPSGRGDNFRGNKIVPRSMSRTSPPRQPTKFSPEDGEIVQPPRYPRSMSLAGPVSKPIPSGPRAMRGLR